MFATSEIRDCIQEGDKVILYENAQSIKAVTVSTSATYQNKFGIFKHKDWIGLPFGSTVQGRPTFRYACWLTLLAPTPELWTKALRHRTQILYVADISVVCGELHLRPGCRVLECGTGSGSLTHSLARAIAPSGHVHTYEFHEMRAEEAAKEFKEHGLSDWITVTHRNIEELGFPEDRHGTADAVFLDLPGPWKVVSSASKCLKANGRFCSFSPCIEQVQKTCDALRSEDFADIRTIECILRHFDVRDELLQSTELFTNPTKRRRVEQPVPNEGPLSEHPSDENKVASSDGMDVANKIDKPDGAQNTPNKGQNGVDAMLGGANDGANEEGKRFDAGRQVTTVAKPFMEAKGHTGYLTFARKLVPL